VVEQSYTAVMLSSAVDCC